MAGSVLTAAAVAYYLKSDHAAPELPYSLTKQSTERAGRVRVSQLIGDGPLVTVPPQGTTTLYEAFQHGLKISAHRPCLGSRPAGDTPYQWLTYAEVAARVANVASGLISLGIRQFLSDFLFSDFFP